MNCTVCNKKLIGKQTKFCSRKCKNTNGNLNNQVYLNQQERGIKRKLFFVNQLGGKCSECGYNKNLAALTFHHINPKEKVVKLDIRRMSNNSFNVLQDEVNKCQLLCHNCHMEEHYPQLEMVGLSGIEPEISLLMRKVF